jgi:hypothetical protein
LAGAVFYKISYSHQDSETDGFCTAKEAVSRLQRRRHGKEALQEFSLSVQRAGRDTAE